MTLETVERQRRTVWGATAFNEMAILARLGRRGWRLVGFGPLFLLLERTDRPWEHTRLVWETRAVRAAMARDGWEYVGRWLTLVYYARPVRDQDAAS